MIDELYKIIRSQPGAVTFPPAPENELRKVQNHLAAHNFCMLPEDCLEFLRLTDGLSYNGIELYGSQPHFRELKNYTFPDLLSANQNYAGYNFFARKIILGRTSENILYFDQSPTCFALADRINLRSRIEAPSLYELLQKIKSLCL